MPDPTPEAVKDALAIFRSFADGLVFKDESLIKELAIISAEELDQNNLQVKISQNIKLIIFIPELFIPHVLCLEKLKQKIIYEQHAKQVL